MPNLDPTPESLIKNYTYVPEGPKNQLEKILGNMKGDEHLIFPGNDLEKLLDNMIGGENEVNPTNPLTTVVKEISELPDEENNEESPAEPVGQ